MIDVENEIFSYVYEKVTAEWPGVLMLGTYERTPTKFPFVSLAETDNAVTARTKDSATNENHVDVTYTAEVFSNADNGKKAECKAIMATLDGAMLALGFSRTMLNAVPNYADATVYRMVARYRATISKDHTIYRKD